MFDEFSTFFKVLSVVYNLKCLMWMLQIEVWVAKRKEPFKRPIIHSNTHTLTFIHSFIQLYLNNNRRAFAHIHMSYNIHSYLHTHSFTHTHVYIHTTIHSYRTPYIHTYIENTIPLTFVIHFPQKFHQPTKPRCAIPQNTYKAWVVWPPNSINPTKKIPSTNKS